MNGATDRDSRREQIDRLLADATTSYDPVSQTAAASVLALLEIADAITALAAEIERAGWRTKER